MSNFCITATGNPHLKEADCLPRYISKFGGGPAQKSWYSIYHKAALSMPSDVWVLVTEKCQEIGGQWVGTLLISGVATTTFKNRFPSLLIFRRLFDTKCVGFG